MLALLTCILFKNCNDVTEYLNNFERVYGHTIKIEISFNYLPHNYNAYCFVENGVIVINPEKWDRFDKYQQEEIIFHELGHCVLGKQHVLTQSIMNRQPLPSEFYRDNRTKLIEELFH